jgi:hypothetical protein
MDNIATTQNQIPNWAFKGDYIETCNCDYSCPCGFLVLPQMDSGALVGYHTREGKYGETRLDGLDIIDAY